MYAIKLTLMLTCITLYLLGTIVGFVVGVPALLESGETADIIGAFGGFLAWLLIGFGFAVHIIKTARPATGGGR